MHLLWIQGRVLKRTRRGKDRDITLLKPPTEKYDLFDFLYGLKKLWFIEHTPISDKEVGDVERNIDLEFCGG